MKMINKLRVRFNALTGREKIIVVATAIVLLWSGWDNFFWSPLNQQQDQLRQNLSLLNQQLSANKQAAMQLESGMAIDPNRLNKSKLAHLNSELIRLQDQVKQLGEKFVPPRLMAQALNDILTQNHQLALVRLDTLPVTKLIEGDNQSLPVYKHGLALTFSGNYLNTLEYLNSLESLPWHINWDSIDYQVKNYPDAETTIRAYTLSFEESWLGI
jgi:MSHA biogenesis protein MshJ